ncbi:MAG TPA: hypothetical protein VM841_03385 [Actinomycetota bacterium]|nr:hypothetical protein [Actinomycetota bacterium]
MTFGSWTRWRVALAMLCVAVAIAPLNPGIADIRGGLVNGYSDHFDYAGVTPTNDVPIDQLQWQITPTASNGTPIPNVWMVGSVQTSTIGGPGSEIKALKQRTTGAAASEPVAFVRNGNWQNLVVQVRAAYDGNSQNSGVGIVFRAPVDPVTGTADKNNFYLFTTSSQVPHPELCPTGRCVALFKRIGGAYFLATMKPTFLNFVNANGPAESHVYKVVMSGNRIQAYVDGRLLIDVTDTPGDDISGTRFSMPGPMFANGTVGLRTSNTRAWFDDFVVMGDSERAYEGRAAAMTTFGQVGAGSTGAVLQATAADTNFQYHDHDFPTGTGTEGTFIGPTSPGNGFTGGALVQTRGQNGTTSSSAQLFGFSGTISQSMPDGSIVDVTLISDTISARASTNCDDPPSTRVELLNFSYLVVVKNAQGLPILNEGKVSQVVPPPNTVISDPQSNGGYVRIVLNSQQTTTDPKRADVSGIQIDFLQRPLTVSSGQSTIADTGITFASVQLANVVAGRLCMPFI